jgi:hypothetical protein
MMATRFYLAEDYLYTVPAGTATKPGKGPPGTPAPAFSGIWDYTGKAVRCRMRTTSGPYNTAAEDPYASGHTKGVQSNEWTRRYNEDLENGASIAPGAWYDLISGANQDGLIIQFISDPLKAATTIAGTMRGQFGCLAAASDYHTQVVA